MRRGEFSYTDGSTRKQLRRIVARRSFAIGASDMYGLPRELDILEQQADSLQARLDHVRRLLSRQHRQRWSRQTYTGVLKLVPADGGESKRALDRKARMESALPQVAITLVAPADSLRLFIACLEDEAGAVNAEVLQYVLVPLSRT
jgi:hypothetical protein